MKSSTNIVRDNSTTGETVELHPVSLVHGSEKMLYTGKVILHCADSPGKSNIIIILINLFSLT